MFYEDPTTRSPHTPNRGALSGDLLAALKLIYAHAESTDQPLVTLDQIADIARTAIAQAEGGGE